MDAQTLWCLLFLALIKNISTNAHVKVGPAELKAKVGSCVEMKCQVTDSLDYEQAHWFWMKDAVWDERKNDYKGIDIYSTDPSQRPVDPDFEKRVTYTGSQSLRYQSNRRDASLTKPLCSILFCDLKETDSAKYSFRFKGRTPWSSTTLNLLVEENKCPITFEETLEANRITLTCSTSSSCPSALQIQDLTSKSRPHVSQRTTNSQKSISASFAVSWADDGKVFSCQTDDNTDKYLIRNVSLYAPKDVSAGGAGDVSEGASVTLTCSAKGNPRPSLSWIKDGLTQSSEAEWTITSIKDSQRGNYVCHAQNRYGSSQSDPVVINVQYLPQVEIKILSPASAVKLGNKIIVKNAIKLVLTCYVRRSNPSPGRYTWTKGGTEVDWSQTYEVGRIGPEDRDSYTCTATNTVGPGRSEPVQLDFQYSPRNTEVSLTGSLKVGSSLTFTCDTDANPLPTTFSWWRNNSSLLAYSSQRNSISQSSRQHVISGVQRADEACYRCSASNLLGNGDDSPPECIQVLYPPTRPALSMAAEATEGQNITVACSVESFPSSTLTLRRTPASTSRPIELTQRDTNALRRTLTVTWMDAGSYTCHAANSEGSNGSYPRTLVVKYSPKNVSVEAHPGLVVNENTPLMLRCAAQSHPPLTSVTWMKRTDGKDQTIQQGAAEGPGEVLTFRVPSAAPSDSGLYSCAASNDIGTERSASAEVEVKYAPKHVDITRGAERQESDGTSSVALSCSSRSHPQVEHYSWYKTMKGEERDKRVSEQQNHTVFSNQPGVYYCVAKNEINQRSSDRVHLFPRDYMQILKFFFLGLVIVLLVILLIVLVRRHKGRKSIQRETTQLLHGLVGWCNGARGANRSSQTLSAEPCRSREDLLQEQSCRPRAQRHQPPPDSKPASNIRTVCCTVNPPQAPRAQDPTRQQDAHAEGDSVDYASLDFRNKPRNKHEEDVVYSVVSKPKHPKKDEQESLQVYENIGVARRQTSPDGWSADPDSDGEVELNYSLVSFSTTPGRRRAGRDSSSSDEYGIQYSDVKV